MTRPGPPTAVNPEPHPHPFSPRLGGSAPVIDDDRPPGAPPRPPTSWPTPRVATPPTPGEPGRRGPSALLVLCAFLFGSLVVGAAFAAYALGDRNDEQGATKSTTTTTQLRATGPLDIQKVLDTIRPSVVTIEAGSPDSLFGGAGTGVVISSDGLILTNAHVIEGAGGNITVRFSDETTAEAELVGSSPSDDIALIRAARDDLTAATLGSSANLLVGDPVVAIGNALNLGGDPSVTSGIVSAKDRAINDGTINLDNLIQTDAAINPGNSGGPLVNANGEVVGINTAIIAGAQNVGFSIAIDSIQDLIEELKNGGGTTEPTTAVLGASSFDVNSPDLPQDILDEYEITEESGALIVAVDADGAAAAGGLEEGDVVVALDGEDVPDAATLTRLIRGYDPGDEVTLTVMRRGERMTFTVTLGP